MGSGSSARAVGVTCSVHLERPTDWESSMRERNRPKSDLSNRAR